MGVDIHGRLHDYPSEDAGGKDWDAFFDLRDKAPGGYFRASWWSWRPIWAYCEHVAPDLCGKVKYAGSNDGDGLGAEDAHALGIKVWESIHDGRAEPAIRSKTDANAALDKDDSAGWYNFGLDHLKEWATFLLHCNGFEIH